MSPKRNVRVLRARLSHACGASLWAMALAALLVCSTQAQDPEDVGRWDPPPLGYDWDVLAEHAMHLSTGKILVWQTGSSARLWDPGDGSFTLVPNDDHNVICSGHTGLADGSILAAGGGGEHSGTATDKTSIFGSGLIPWQAVDRMFFTRWYPTCTTLPNGKVLAISGKDKPGEEGVFIPLPEVYDPGADEWSFPSLEIQPEDTWTIYPFMFLLPDGTVFFAGPGRPTYTFDLLETWTFVGESHFGAGGGSAVTYEPGVVLKCGGTGGDRTEEIDFNLGTGWVEVDRMEQVRGQHNLVLLPDGKILAVGGRNNCVPDVGCEPVMAAEWFDPDEAFPAWIELAAMTRPRAHHSTAVLLPDGKVLACGGDDFLGHPTSKSGEIFSPPYLFGGERPVIGFAPTVISYGGSFSVISSGISPGAADIEKVSLLRLAAVTHSFDHNQRYVPLEFAVTAPNRLSVQAPDDGNKAPPGYYMLFLVTDDGVPSVAKYVRLE